MTCVVGLVANSKVYIGADSLGSGNGVKQVYNTPKLAVLDINYRKDKYSLQQVPMLIGYTSSYRMGDLLRYKLTPPPLDTIQGINDYLVVDFIPELIKCFEENHFAKTKEGSKSGGNFLIGFEERLFQVQDDFSVLEPECAYTAVGSGQEFAMGAMYALSSVTISPEEQVREAIEAASEFSTTVGGPITVLNI